MAQPDAAGARQRYSDHTLLVRFVDRDAALAAARETPAILRAVDAKVTWVGRHVPGLAIVEVETPQFLDVTRELLAARDDVVRVERDPMIYPLIEPTDPSYSLQHPYMKLIDFTGAWDLTTSSDQIIAVLDSGVEYNIPELAANIERNFGEPAIPNGIDDDQNGYVDDHWGYEFLDKYDPNSTLPYPLDVEYPGHGTGVTSVLGATTNNSLAIAGALWQSRMVPVKILGQLNGSLASNAILGMEYGYQRGARIINCSWYTPANVAALKDQMNAMQDVLFVFAAGNFWFDLDGQSRCFDMYPQLWSLDNSIIVGGSEDEERWLDENLPNGCDQALVQQPGTCWGSESVDLFAPAHLILHVDRFGAVITNTSGTSLATPLVTGAAAMVRDLHPEWTPNQVRLHLMNTGDVFPGLVGFCKSGKRLNVRRAIGGT